MRGPPSAILGAFSQLKTTALPPLALGARPADAHASARGGGFEPASEFAPHPCGPSRGYRRSFRPMLPPVSSALRPILLLAVATALPLRAAAPATPPPEETVALEKFEVTGQKLGRTAQETPTSVAAYTARELERTPDTTLFDVFQRTANTFANTDGFSIRGISNTGTTFTEGTDLATVLLDGANVDSQMLAYDGLSIWDLDQMEILRGPQSTSQGRNSLAGAVVARTRNPTFTYDGHLRATYGERHSYQLALAAGGPVIRDLLAFRFTVERKYSDGEVTNVTRREDDWHRLDNTTYRGKLLFQPAKWRGFSALLTAAQTDSANGERAYSYGLTRDELFRGLAYENTRNDFDSRSRLASLEVNQELPNGWLLTSTTAWSDFRSRSAYDGDRTPTETLVYGFGYDNSTRSEELRLLAKGANWRLLTGLYFAEAERGYNSDGPFYYTIPSPLDAVFGLPSPPRALLTVIQQSKVVSRNSALFLNGDWTPVRRWTFAAGVRFDREKLDRDSLQQVGLLRGFPNHVARFAVPSLGIPAGAPADTIIQRLTADATARSTGADTFNTLLPSGGLTYHWSDDVSTGFTYSRGYRSGGVSFNQKQARIVPYEPEYTANYELSFRSQWLQRKVTFNANAFYVDWTDQQVAVQLSSDVYDRQVNNAGKSTYYGVEFELREQLGGGWSAYQTLGHTRTRFDHFVTSTTDYTGKEFPRAPRWTLAAGVSYQHRQGWFGTGGLSSISNVYGNADNDPTLRLNERLLLNAKLGYALRGWSVYVYGTNLLDDRYFDVLWRETPTTLAATTGAPRTVGLGIEARF